MTVPVIAWGLGLDRMAMVALGIHDIRELFTDNLELIRTTRGAVLDCHMPTITIFKQDLDGLLAAPGRGSPTVTMEQLEESLMLVKGELKGHNPETGELRIELQDSNRPDLWCCEGIARQIRIKRQGALAKYYSSHDQNTESPKRLIVAPGMEQVRPYVAACTANGYRVTQEGLAQLIQTQEKLADMFGRKRRTVSIGIYRLRRSSFPSPMIWSKPEKCSLRHWVWKR